MSDPKNPQEDRTASDEFREGVSHLFAAARKVASQVEPQVNRSFEEAERALDRLGHEGEVMASEVSREVATFAARLAEKLRAVADRTEGKTSDRPPQDDPSDKGGR